MPEARLRVAVAAELANVPGLLDALAAGFEAELREAFAELAVPGDPVVTAESDDGRLPARLTMRIAADGRDAWIAQEPMAAGLAIAERSWPIPPAWYYRLPEHLKLLDTGGLRTTMRQVARAVISRQPAIMFGEAQADALARELDVDDRRLRHLVDRLLQMRRSLHDRAGLAAACEHARDLPIEGVAEALVAERAGRPLEVLLEPALLRDITTAADDDGRSLFAHLCQGIFDEIGIVLPPIRLTGAPELPQACASFRLGDLRTAYLRVPMSTETVVQGAYDYPGGIPTAIPPGAQAATVLPTELVQERLGGAIAWTGLEFVVLALAELARRYGDTMMDLAAAEERMAVLESWRPRLAQAIMRQHSSTELTLLLRNLLRDGVPIRDLLSIALAILDGDGSPEPLVRRRLAYTAISRLCSDTNTLVAYIVDSAIEERLAAGHDAAEEELVLALAEEMSYLGPEHPPPVVLTGDAARPRASAAVRSAWPDVHVTCYGELPAWLRVMPVARVQAPSEAA